MKYPILTINKIKMKNLKFYIFPALFFSFLLLSFKIIFKEKAEPLKNLKDIVYAKNLDTIGENDPLNLDLYFPKGATTDKKYPFVMIIHGGGFRNGTKEDFGKACQHLADSGFIAASINYRMGYTVQEAKGVNRQTSTQSAAAYRAFQDANAAMRFLIAKAKEYAIDTSKLFIGGGSAGAMMALNVAYDTEEFYKKNQPELVKGLGGLRNSGNEFKNTFSVKGICSMWGALPDSTLITKTNAIPTIFFHGTEDPAVPIDIGFGIAKGTRFFGTLCLYRQLRKYNQPAIAHIMPGGKHVVKEYSQQRTFAFPMENTACFFKKVLNKKVNSGIYYKMDGSCKL